MIKNKKGFLFIEVMIAAIILTAGITAVLGAFHTAVLAVKDTQEYSKAVFLIDEVFFRSQTEKDQKPQDEGVFEDGLTEFNWKIAKIRQGDLPLMDLDMSVWWKTKKAKRTLQAATLLPIEED